MSKVTISGIQQIGIGVKDVKEAWKWYKKFFGFDVRVFEDAAVANFMLPYTGGEPRERYAALSLNMQGGGGFEIWQYTKRQPQSPVKEPKLGDLGFYYAKIRTDNADKTFSFFKENELNIMTEPVEDPRGTKHFYVRDPFGNIFNIIEDNTSWFKPENKYTGGTFGVSVGCTDIEKSISFYKDILGYDKVVYQGEGEYKDFEGLPAISTKFKRAILTHEEPRKGGFSRLFGHSEIELIQAVGGEKPSKIFKDRFWGDLGFIHLCFDVVGMEHLREQCEKAGYPFTVDSSKSQEGQSFDMGEAAGYFSYIEDPDGALIEFVETHKVPIMKKLGLYLNLRKRDAKKPLPNYIVKALGLNRFKE